MVCISSTISSITLTTLLPSQWLVTPQILHIDVNLNQWINQRGWPCHICITALHDIQGFILGDFPSLREIACISLSAYTPPHHTVTNIGSRVLNIVQLLFVHCVCPFA